MSRGYRIEVPLQTARGTVTGSDSLCISLDVLPILPEESMRQIVRETLKERGWKEGKDGALEKVLGQGATAVLDKDGKTVTVRLETEQAVEGQGRTDQEAKAALDSKKADVEREARSRSTQRLARAEPAVRSELDDAVQRVYVEALKKKAASMGAVESMQETKGSDGSLEITIKVKA
ncbi:MAG TPA: hypothetical protein VGO62_01930 [Myxococcota bacterium]|jgi:hypothetical protein